MKNELGEVKNEHLEIDSKQYETKFNMVAAGLIADELPSSVVDTFIKHIETTMGVFMPLQDDSKPVK